MHASRAKLAKVVDPLLRFVLMPGNDAQAFSFQRKGLLKAGLRLLLGICHVEVVDTWSRIWAKVGGTFWMSRLLRDRDSVVRKLGAAAMALAVDPRALPTWVMVLSRWKEAPSCLVRLMLKSGECESARCMAIKFLAHGL